MIINWTKIAEEIYTQLKNDIKSFKSKPSLWAILVWNNPSSLRYIKQKEKWAKEIWINFILKKIPENIKERDLYNIVKEFNDDININWYIVQLPLPPHIDSQKIINNIHPKKDVDGFHPNNMWKVLLWDKNWFVPCTPAGIIEILEKEEIKVEWKKVCVIWRSNIVWKPMVSLLINMWATVIACNSKTKDLDRHTSSADVVIVAAWNPWLLKVNMIKYWAVIIDVWFTVIDDTIYGDADTKLIDLVWNKITPVPGWVWSLTVAMLMKNTVKAYKIQNK